jgi:hypothetical protein
MGVNTAKVPGILAEWVPPGRGGLNLDAVLGGLAIVGPPAEILDQALVDAQSHPALRPWRFYLLRALQELAARDHLNSALMSHLWDHTLSLVEVLGEEEIDRTLSALSYTVPGREVLTGRVLAQLVNWQDAERGGVDWGRWLCHAAGLLVERGTDPERVVAHIRALARKSQNDRGRHAAEVLAESLSRQFRRQEPPTNHP